MRSMLLACLLATSCVRAPASIDVVALVAKRGPADAHLELSLRVIDHPRDIAARLALAELAEKLGRPSEAIEQLETVEHLGGPLGTRWHDSDRGRLGRLLLARGRARLARGAGTALDDFARATSLGISPTPDELRAARVASALALLRHVDDKVRAKGRAELAEADPRSRTTTPAEHGALGAWLWTLDARREAYAQLAAWHDATHPPRDEALQAAYLRALAWWSPFWLGEVPPPPADDLVGPERCMFPGADCTPPATPPPSPPPLAPDPLTDPRTTAAARYAATRPFARSLLPDLEALATPQAPDGATPHAPDGATPHAPSVATTHAPSVAVATAHASDAAVRESLERDLAAIATAHARDAAVAERIGRDLVARATDAAAAYATLGTLYDALDDHARARAAWQAAVDGSNEPTFVRGLAEAAAREGDGPAALVFATSAAAAWGDPAVVWNAVAAALLEAQQFPEALTATRMALDLAGPDELDRALELAIAGSRAMGRNEQTSNLEVERARFAIAHTRSVHYDAVELAAALSEHRAHPTAATLARLWVASRASPRDIEVRAVLRAELDANDPRRVVIERELVELAGAPDARTALEATRALR